MLLKILPFALHRSPLSVQALQRRWSSTESESYITTDGQSASLSWNKAPIWGLRPHFYYCRTVEGLLMWSALSDERTGLSFTIASGPRQHSHFRVRVPHFTISDSRLPFSSPPTTRKATVEVFEPASTRESHGPPLGWWRLYIASVQTS
jgi:hypothetical protein